MNSPTKPRGWSPLVYRSLGVLPVLIVAWLCWMSTKTDKPASGEKIEGANTATQREEKPESSPKIAHEHKHTNALVHETSPYLLQHAHNPVNWLPWGEEAFKLAREQKKPIFLSVGYSTCYWCHVMERESFEDEEVAAILNEHFVCVKVDREERPDVDEQYMLATQLTGRGGGWPNSVWLTADGRPWMAGTYFPREQFMQGLLRLAAIWKEHPEAVEKQANSFAEGIKETAGGERKMPPQKLDADLAARLLAHMTEQFDATHGGFGSRPKFPPHGNLEFLLREVGRVSSPANPRNGSSLAGEDARPTSMITETLDAIWQGGIHDHVGGGFHRYATDQRWLLPHFEKMLYDNAQLMRSYTDAYVLANDERYREAVADIFAWLSREMTDPQGGFYSALDSESEGHEGKFYVWSLAELKEALSEQEADLFASVYNFEADGNFAEERTGERTGANIPHLTRSLASVAEERKIEVAKLDQDLAMIRAKLLAARSKRVYPHRDDKVLASWNGLMIAALAHAGQKLDEPQYTQAATKAAEFVWNDMRNDGALQRSWRAGTAHLPAYLDDYAYLADGLLELHTATGEKKWLERTRELADAMIADFEDPAGGFFFTSARHEELLIRSKNVTGGGNLPTANGVAAQVLLRLAKATGEKRYATSARRTVENLSGIMHRAPQATESLVIAATMLLDDPALAKSNASYESFPVTVEIVSPKTTLKPGDDLQIEVKLNIEKGWHLYGLNPKAKFVSPTTLTVEENELVKVVEVKSPQGMTSLDRVAKEELVTYEGQIIFRVLIRASDDAAGKTTLRLPLRFQACDDARCLEPQKTVLELPLEIGAKE